MGGISAGALGIPGFVASLVYDGATDTILQSQGIASVVRGSAGTYTVTVKAWAADGGGNGFLASLANAAAFGFIVCSTTPAYPWVAGQIQLSVSNNAAVPEDAVVCAVFW